MSETRHNTLPVLAHRCQAMIGGVLVMSPAAAAAGHLAWLEYVCHGATADTRSCLTCLHLCTHEKCGSPCGEDSCLGNNGNGGGGYAYRNWEAGSFPEAKERQHRLEVLGERSFTLGGQGEACVNANASPNATAHGLHHIAEQVGYVCWNLQPWHEGGGRQLTITTCGGTYTLYWRKHTGHAEEVLDHIDEHQREGGRICCWSRSPISIVL